MPLAYAVVAVGIRARGGVTEVLLLQEEDGSFYLPLGPALPGESVPVAAARVLTGQTGCRGTALRGVMEMITACDGELALALLVIDCEPVQGPAAGLTPVWRSVAQASQDLLIERAQRDSGSMLGALERMVNAWTNARPYLA
jgi:hypothetical protein